MCDFLRIRTVEESLEELTKSLAINNEICLRDVDFGGGKDTMQIINSYLHTYLADMSNTENSIQLVDALADIMRPLAVSNAKLSDANYAAGAALRQEGLFTPKMMYQIKEDLETVSQLHIKHKKETARLIEEGQIATRRNAELQIKIMDLEAAIWQGKPPYSKTIHRR